MSERFHLMDKVFYLHAPEGIGRSKLAANAEKLLGAPMTDRNRMGYFPAAKEPALILGEEAAGIVERDGPGFKVGERVIVYGGGLGVFRDGTWAEMVAVPASSLRRLPEDISFEEGDSVLR